MTYEDALAAYLDELMACHDEMVVNLFKRLEKGNDNEKVIADAERLEKFWQRRLDTLQKNIRPDLMNEYEDFYCEHFWEKIKETREVIRWARYMQKESSSALSRVACK